MEDLILQGVGIVVTALIAWVATAIKKQTGIEIEAKHREALHSALMTGARLALAKQLTGAKAIEVIGGWVIEAVPDALDHFGIERKVTRLDSKLEKMAESYLGVNVDLPIDKFVTTDRLTYELEKIFKDRELRRG